MEKLEKVFKVFQWSLLTIGIAFAALIITVHMFAACQPTNTRNIQYENYCDSIWENDKDYYIDVLEETDEYQDYLEANGQWW